MRDAARSSETLVKLFMSSVETVDEMRNNMRRVRFENVFYYLRE